MGSKLKCNNCDSQLAEDSKYCARCGQRILNSEKPIRPMIAEMLHETLDIDGRMLVTLKALLFKPGFLSLEYKNGKRTTYTPPLRLYLVFSISFFFLLSMLDLKSYEQLDGASINPEYYPRIMFVLLPVFALFLQLLFRGTFYLSNLIFAIHIHCLAYLVFAITIPLEVYEQRYQIFIFLQIPFIIYLLSYIALALKRYYAQSWRSVIAKFSALFVLYAAVMGIGFAYFLTVVS